MGVPLGAPQRMGIFCSKRPSFMLKVGEYVLNMLAKVYEFFENVCGIFLAMAGLQTLFSRCFEGIFPFSRSQGLILRSAKVIHLIPHLKAQ